MNRTVHGITFADNDNFLYLQLVIRYSRLFSRNILELEMVISFDCSGTHLGGNFEARSNSNGDFYVHNGQHCLSDNFEWISEAICHYRLSEWSSTLAGQ